MRDREGLRREAVRIKDVPAEVGGSDEAGISVLVRVGGEGRERMGSSDKNDGKGGLAEPRLRGNNRPEDPTHVE